MTQPAQEPVTLVNLSFEGLARTEVEPPAAPVEELAVFATASPLTGTQFITSPHQYSVALPSKGVFYGMRGDVIASLVRGKHQIKFTRAAQAASYRYLVEAMQSTLTNCDVGMLTQQDTVFLLYWLRLNSYSTMQFTHVTYCNDPKHLARVASGELEEATLKSVDIVSRTNLNIEELNPKVVEAYAQTLRAEYRHVLQELAAAGLVLSPPLTRDVILLSEMLEEPPYADDEDAQELLDAALYVGSPDGTFLDLERRSALVAEFSPEAMGVLRAWQAISTNYGVTETRAVTCTTCGAHREVNLMCSAADFL